MSLLFVAGAGVSVSDRAEGIPAERGSGPLSGERSKRFRASASRKWSAISRKSRPSSRRIRTSRGSAAASGFGGGGGGGGGASKPGPVRRRPEAARRAYALGGPDHGRAAAEAGAGAGRACVHGQSSADQSRRRWRRPRHLPVHSAGYRHRRALSIGAALRRRDAEDSEHRGRQQRPPAQQSAGADQPEPRPDRGAWA